MDARLDDEVARDLDMDVGKDLQLPGSLTYQRSSTAPWREVESDRHQSSEPPIDSQHDNDVVHSNKHGMIDRARPCARMNVFRSLSRTAKMQKVPAFSTTAASTPSSLSHELSPLSQRASESLDDKSTTIKQLYTECFWTRSSPSRPLSTGSEHGHEPSTGMSGHHPCLQPDNDEQASQTSQSVSRDTTPVDCSNKSLGPRPELVLHLTENNPHQQSLYKNAMTIEHQDTEPPTACLQALCNQVQHINDQLQHKVVSDQHVVQSLRTTSDGVSHVAALIEGHASAIKSLTGQRAQIVELSRLCESLREETSLSKASIASIEAKMEQNLTTIQSHFQATWTKAALETKTLDDSIKDKIESEGKQLKNSLSDVQSHGSAHAGTLEKVQEVLCQIQQTLTWQDANADKDRLSNGEMATGLKSLQCQVHALMSSIMADRVATSAEIKNIIEELRIEMSVLSSRAGELLPSIHSLSHNENARKLAISACDTRIMAQEEQIKDLVERFRVHEEDSCDALSRRLDDMHSSIMAALISQSRAVHTCSTQQDGANMQADEVTPDNIVTQELRQEIQRLEGELAHSTERSNLIHKEYAEQMANFQRGFVATSEKTNRADICRKANTIRTLEKSLKDQMSEVERLEGQLHAQTKVMAGLPDAISQDHELVELRERLQHVRQSLYESQVEHDNVNKLREAHLQQLTKAHEDQVGQLEKQLAQEIDGRKRDHQSLENEKEAMQREWTTEHDRFEQERARLEALIDQRARRNEGLDPRSDSIEAWMQELASEYSTAPEKAQSDKLEKGDDEESSRNQSVSAGEMNTALSTDGTRQRRKIDRYNDKVGIRTMPKLSNGDQDQAQVSGRDRDVSGQGHHPSAASDCDFFTQQSTETSLARWNLAIEQRQQLQGGIEVDKPSNVDTAHIVSDSSSLLSDIDEALLAQSPTVMVQAMKSASRTSASTRPSVLLSKAATLAKSVPRSFPQPNSCSKIVSKSGGFRIASASQQRSVSVNPHQHSQPSEGSTKLEATSHRLLRSKTCATTATSRSKGSTKRKRTDDFNVRFAQELAM